ncbi:MAG: RNA polymerase sigma factor [Solirubrobacterales bacterium]|nr:RNA polymerase sigma factor [Solirubrobacterales bacterium]
MPPAPTGPEASTPSGDASVEAIWRIESARIVASMARLTGDLGLAEDLAQEAFVKALEEWPAKGVPENPGAWLTTVARNRGLDRIRRDRVLREKYSELALELSRAEPESEPETIATSDEIGDDVLTLIFTACHPAISPDSQVALTLKAVGGLTTGEIARAFLVPPPTVAQRIVRAKRTLSEGGIRFEPPEPDELDLRLAAVLGVVYLIFNEGYVATKGNSWMRPDLAGEALRLGRVLTGLAPTEPEVLGLLSLMEIQASRFPARSGPDGQAVPLLEQDRSRWDQLTLRLGLQRLGQARELGGSGPYFLQASIAACHGRARHAEDTDWEEIVRLYDRMLETDETPVLRLNRAVALGMCGRPREGLAEVERLEAEGNLAGYHLVPAVRGDLLEKLGRPDEARAAFTNAAEMSGNEQERRVLERRATGGRLFST